MKYKKIVSLVLSISLLASFTSFEGISSLGVSAEDDVVETTQETTTTDATTGEDTAPVELVNGQVPTSEDSFEFNEETYTITKYIGLDMDVVIPRTIHGVPVRVIGVECFKNNNIVKKITVPNSVSSIDYSLQGWGAFGGSSVEEVIFEDSSNVTALEDGTFMDCKSLVNIVLPDNLKSIGWKAFSHCRGLINIELPNTVTSISMYAFENCDNLKSINIPSSVNSIGKDVFNGCTSLLTIDFSEGITSIGKEAFNGCISLTEVSLPDTVVSLGEKAFYGCSNMTTLKLSSNLNMISESCFHGCKALTSVEIPASVKSIGIEAFRGCTSLKDITFNEGLVSICERAFLEDGAIDDVVIPNTTTSIGNSAFKDCKNISTLKTTGKVSLGNSAFLGCSSLVKAELSAETTVGEKALGRNAYLFDIAVLMKNKGTIFTIYGYTGSSANKYAIDNKIPFVDVETDNFDENTVSKEDTTKPGDSTSTDVKKGDVNGDGKVNTADLLVIKKYLLGLIDTL